MAVWTFLNKNKSTFNFNCQNDRYRTLSIASQSAIALRPKYFNDDIYLYAVQLRSIKTERERKRNSQNDAHKRK